MSPTPTKQVFVLISQAVADNAEKYLWDSPVDGTYEVIFQEVKKDKTLKQLGALFGLWVDFISHDYGVSVDEVHTWLKDKFLARIYITEPIGDMQEQWTELLYQYQESGDQAKLKKHAARISLSWATLAQTKQYMTVIEQHYQSIGKPLPVIDKYYRHFKK